MEASKTSMERVGTHRTGRSIRDLLAGEEQVQEEEAAMLVNITTFVPTITSDVLTKRNACAELFQVPGTVLAPAPSCGAWGCTKNDNTVDQSACNAGGGRKGSNVKYIRQVPKFLQGHMHLLGARTDEDVQEQLSAKREMPQWDSDEDEAAEKEVTYCVTVFLECTVIDFRMGSSWDALAMRFSTSNEADSAAHAGCLKEGSGPGCQPCRAVSRARQPGRQE